MLDSKQRLFVNIRDLSRSFLKSSGRKALQVLHEQPVDEDDLRDICLNRVKDEEEEASEAAFFFDSQPTPVIEMKSFLSQAGLSKETTSSQSTSGAQRGALPSNMFTHEVDDYDTHLMHSSSFGQQSVTGLHTAPQTESLTTPVVDPNFAPSFTGHSIPTDMQTALYDGFDQEQGEFVSAHRLVIEPTILDSSASNFPMQFAAPPQYHQRYESPAETSTQLPESVQEIHRPSVSSVGPSESSSSSSPPSPKGNPELKRKRSDSDCGKKGRMTKKQQYDALVSRKSQLEDDNFNLKEKVDGYERACRRLKQMLYNRIKQQRA